MLGLLDLDAWGQLWSASGKLIKLAFYWCQIDKGILLAEECND